MKTGKGLAQYAIAQLGRPYWWGTFGQTASRGLFVSKANQYPSYYTANDFEEQFGQKVHDCVGLIKGYLWCDSPNSEPNYKSYQDVAVSGLYNVCDERGDLSSIPEEAGICVFQANMGHVGVYIGNGKVVEAMGHKWGVIMTDLYARKWAYWGKPKWISYTGGNSIAPTRPKKPVSNRPTYFYTVKLPLLKMGMVCAEVKKAQEHLIAKGFECGIDGADGEFGMNTKKAVEAFQTAKKILVDGEIGIDTWKALTDM